jgi:hypothetical protein
VATYYWVGGNGNWDATTTTNWASSSGGAGGAGVPTSADDVIFDANSNTGTNAFTVTVTGTSSDPAVCNDFSTGGAGGALDGAMTLTMGATAALDVYGSMTLPATNFSISATLGAITTFRSTTTGKTFTTNGVSFGQCQVIFNGVNGGWSLGSAFTSTTLLVVTNGDFNTANYNITASTFQSTGTETRVITLGSSALTLSSANPVNIPNQTNLTFNANTSTITCSGANPTLNTANGLTFYNVSFTSAAAGTTTINGANTFNNLTQTSRGATGIRNLNLGDNQTVSGTLTLGAANTAIRRVRVRSTTTGTQRTITLNGTLAALADVDFRDINAAGTVATPWTGTRLGDGLGNANITFDAPKTVYRVGTGNWSATQWSLSSGGAVDVNNFPLAQDTMIFDANTTTGTHTIDQVWDLGELDCSAVTAAVTIASGTQVPTFYGDITLDADITLTGTGAWTLAGQGTTQTITSAGVTFTQPLIIDSPSGTVLLADNLTTDLDITLTQGTLDLDDNTLTCRRFISSNSNTRSIAFGTTGQIDVTGNAGTIWTTDNGTNLTFTGTPTVNATYSGSTGTRIIVGTQTNPSINNVANINITAGTDAVTVQGLRSYKNLDFTGFSGISSAVSNTRTLYGNLTISSGMVFTASTGDFAFVATSGTQTITTNGVTLDCPITVNAPGATVELQDNLTIGSTRTFTLTAGTLDLNDNTLSTGLFSSSNSNTRNITFGTSGVLDCVDNFTATTGTNLTTSGTGTIKMSSGSAKTFAGGGASYPVLEQAGAGTLTITGANTFKDITNTTQPATIIFPAGITTKVNNFSLNGTAGNLITIQSSIPGTRFKLSYEDL